MYTFVVTSSGDNSLSARPWDIHKKKWSSKKTTLPTKPDKMNLFCKVSTLQKSKKTIQRTQKEVEMDKLMHLFTKLSKFPTSATADNKLDQTYMVPLVLAM